VTTTTPQPVEVALTPAEVAVLDELCRDGADDGVIAERVGVSVWTIKSQMKAIRLAVGVGNRTAVVAAVLHGHVEIVDRPPARRGPRPRVTAPAAAPMLPVVRVGPSRVHLGPRPGAILLATDCCHHLVEDLPGTDTLTRSPDRVTCGRADR